MEELDIDQIGEKEDSPAKLEAVKKTPKKYVLFAWEFNAVVAKFKELAAQIKDKKIPTFQEISDNNPNQDGYGGAIIFGNKNLNFDGEYSNYKRRVSLSTKGFVLAKYRNDRYDSAVRIDLNEYGLDMGIQYGKNWKSIHLDPEGIKLTATGNDGHPKAIKLLFPLDEAGKDGSTIEKTLATLDDIPTGGAADVDSGSFIPVFLELENISDVVGSGTYTRIKNIVYVTLTAHHSTILGGVFSNFKFSLPVPKATNIWKAVGTSTTVQKAEGKGVFSTAIAYAWTETTGYVDFYAVQGVWGINGTGFTVITMQYDITN